MNTAFISLSAIRRFIFIASTGIIAQMTGCGHGPVPPDSAIARNGNTPAVKISEPGPHEVVVVVNYNGSIGVHAGMFAGHHLLDPFGGYESKRMIHRNWPGPSLEDYVRFQMEDGPSVLIYRFNLTPDQFATIERKVQSVVFTFPSFCATEVHNVIAGTRPFDTLPERWWLSPGALAQELDPLIAGSNPTGVCVWPEGTPCHADDRSRSASK